MKIIMLSLLAVFVFTATEPTFGDIGYVSGYSRHDGSYVQGYYKDTSGDGNPYNNRKALWGY